MIDDAPRDFDALRLAPEDNVATVLRAVAAGETLRVKCGAAFEAIVAREAIPFCHKISLTDIAGGARVLKYGSAIGTAPGKIERGSHVHVHNMRSARAQAGATTVAVEPRDHIGG